MRIIIRQFLNCLLLCLVTTATGAATDLLAYEEQSLSVNGTRQVARVPKGFRLELLTDKLDGPRLMAFADNGDLVIGSKSGRVYRLPPPYTSPEVLVSLDDYPHSVAIRQGEIFIARTHGVYRAPYQPGQKQIAPASVKLLARLPGGDGHSSRTVGVGPDGRVYVSLGIQGNCSDQYLGDRYSFDDRRGGIFVLHQEGSQARWEVFGSGLRNPVGFAWHPQTHVMYASNNGPDHLGYEQPPEYFSRITPGSFHGMPWFQHDGKQLKHDGCATSKSPRPLADVAPPVATFPARNAPMGVTFVPKGALSKALELDAVVALRGSWGTQPTGGSFGNPATRRPPKLVVVRFKDGGAVRVDDLVTGFQLADGDRWARPVGVAIGPDGALYFTSDSEINGLFRLLAKQAE
ncbi:MAG: PQQ-dependent sugar dehydrogenase [Sulfuricaulis sp.]|nr:PQQ-dependent sugar dehydrogenase [Sulfuricaulis sp.]